MNSGSRVVKTFCGICAGLCGLDVELDITGEITDIRGDRNNPLTQGYA
jgi:anaerobic selenocysteine-containing dehydrogenase